MRPSIVCADSVLEFQVKESSNSAATTQSLAIKDGKIMIKAVGPDKNLDLLYNRAADSVVIADHSKHTLMTVDEKQVERIGQQAQEVQPLLQGFSKQIAKISPEQRQKWQELLGDSVSLDKIAKAAVPPAPTRLVPTVVSKVAGIRCQTMRVMQGATPMAEVCLAEAAATKIPDQDAATIRALLGFYERLTTKSQGLACQFGLTLPSITMPEETLIPILFRDFSRDENGSVILQHVKTSTISPEQMLIPSAYKMEPLTFWP